ncbi:Coatomer subunit delta-2 [Hibiscus syriacus]|uniref:Coatomer subunit delta n=1 Tax=Hibiscus syriacus TaxID=106335 RepID=A0A6A3CBJ7_HIBSY|nr:Coatomer subunit delta-2 [Hibiscus syriacus]
MTRMRIEGLLVAFPKLVGTGKQHTYVESENERYVYQPIEALYLLLVTNKQSNILEDLETLRLLSKLVPEYCYTLDEDGICKTAFDEVICLGHKENVTVAQSKINETKDIMKRKASEIDKCKAANLHLQLLLLKPRAGQSRVVAPAPTDPITLTAEEKLNMHPNMSKELFVNENILGLKDPNRPFPTGPAGDAAGVGLLKWRMQSADESMVPLTINCWPSVSGNETYVSIIFDLRNVVISVPLPALREAPNVNQIDGEWRYDSRNSVLEWSIVLIDNSNCSGSMEFVVPPADSSVFFPISVRFSATMT